MSDEPSPSAAAVPPAPPLASLAALADGAGRPHLFSLLPEELLAHLLAHGGAPVREDEARRLLVHVLGRGGPAQAQRRPVSRRLLALRDATTDQRRLEIVERVTDPGDGFVKYLLRSPDGALSEAVRIPLHRPGHFSVCLSSQVGCAMGCVFCATGRLGLARNLLAWEMVAAFLAVRDEAPGPITGAVFQGQGEPLHNYDEVVRAARVLSHPSGCQISADAITISTVGLVPQIRRYARERQPFRLIISLTSAQPERRRRLLPVAGRFPLGDLAEAIREYAAVARGRVTIAWVLMGGENHGRDEVEALRALLPGVPLRLNLIDVNDAREEGLRRVTDAERRGFMDELQVLRAPIVRRYSGGASRHAACGMLAATRLEDEPPRGAR